MMGSARGRRNALRLLHLLAGALLATYVYLPPGQAPWLRWALMLLVVPAVIVTGVRMWQQAAIRRLLTRTRRAPLPRSSAPSR